MAYNKASAQRRNKKYYDTHRDAELLRAQAYRTQNHEKALASTMNWRAKNPEWSKDYNIKYYHANRSVLKANQQARNRTKREMVLQHCGSVCACCGESRYEFLAIDHIDGGGKKHLSQIGQRIVDYLVSQDFPSGFQVLCHNCNSAKGFHKQCPHLDYSVTYETGGLACVSEVI